MSATKTTEWAQAYKPFSNGSEFESWSSRNCHTCKYGAAGDEQPHCVGEFGLMLGLFDDGSVPVMAINFIGTTQRDMDEEKPFCTLKRDCQGYEIPDDVLDEVPEENLKDTELKEVVEEAFDKHGYKLSDLIRRRILNNQW